ncbi:MAG: hypothetical protein M0Z94_18710 [Dehalococcoidales bacterium]|nr:hypothetical protein [Dehalococcoidales bacterium]
MLNDATRRRLTTGFAQLVAVSAVILGTSAPALADCYQGPTLISDLCGTATWGEDYDTKGAMASFGLEAEGHSFLLAALKSSLTIWDVANPLAPTVKATLAMPWDGSSIPSDTHWVYVAHFPSIATTPGYPYALVSLNDYGWDFLHVGAASQEFLHNGYRPAAQLSLGNYVSAVLFEQNGTVYAVGQKLDQASEAAPDSAIRVYALGTLASPSPPAGYATMGQGVRVPAGMAGDGAYAGFPLHLGSNLFWTYRDVASGRIFLLVRYLTGTGLLIVDLTDPAHPQPLQWIPTDSTLFGGQWAVDAADQMIWVADPIHPVVHPYRIEVGTSPPSFSLQPQAAIPYWGDGTATVQGTALSAVGGLLVAAGGDKLGYLRIPSTGAPVLLPSEVPFTDLSGRVCKNAVYKESVSSLFAFQVGQGYYVCRSMIVDAEIVGVADGCVSGSDGGGALDASDESEGGGALDASAESDGGGALDASAENDGGEPADAGGASDGGKSLGGNASGDEAASGCSCSLADRRSSGGALALALLTGVAFLCRRRLAESARKA